LETIKKQVAAREKDMQRMQRDNADMAAKLETLKHTLAEEHESKINLERSFFLSFFHLFITFQPGFIVSSFVFISFSSAARRPASKSPQVSSSLSD